MSAGESLSNVASTTSARLPKVRISDQTLEILALFNPHVLTPEETRLGLINSVYTARKRGTDDYPFCKRLRNHEKSVGSIPVKLETTRNKGVGKTSAAFRYKHHCSTSSTKASSSTPSSSGSSSSRDKLKNRDVEEVRGRRRSRAQKMRG